MILKEDLFEEVEEELKEQILNEEENLLDKAYNGSYYTISGAGGNLEDWKKGYQELLDKEGIGTIKEWVTFKGSDMNSKYNLTGDNAYPDDLTFLAFPLDGLNMNKLPMFKIKMRDRWFDDIVDNNLKREGIDESLNEDQETLYQKFAHKVHLMKNDDDYQELDREVANSNLDPHEKYQLQLLMYNAFKRGYKEDFDESLNEEVEDKLTIKVKDLKEGDKILFPSGVVEVFQIDKWDDYVTLHYNGNRGEGWHDYKYDDFVTISNEEVIDEVYDKEEIINGYVIRKSDNSDNYFIYDNNGHVEDKEHRGQGYSTFEQAKERVLSLPKGIAKNYNEDFSKWRNRWIEDLTGEIIEVRTGQGIRIRKGDKIKDDFVTGFDPDTNTVYLNEDPNVDGGRDYSVEDVVSFMDENINEDLYSLEKDEDKKRQELQNAVDYAIKAFGRIGGGLYQDLDEVGYYVDESDGKYIVKKKVIKESIDPKANEDGPKIKDTGIAQSLIDAINGEWDTVKLYNDIVVNLETYGYADIADVIRDITNEEHVHIGQLQKALETISPNVNSINDGEQEAEGQLTNTTEVDDLATYELDEKYSPMGIDPYKVDYSENEKAFAIYNKFKANNKLDDLFDYLASGLSEPFKNKKDYLDYVADTDIKDFEMYNGKLEENKWWMFSDE